MRTFIATCYCGMGVLCTVLCLFASGVLFAAYLPRQPEAPIWFAVFLAAFGFVCHIFTAAWLAVVVDRVDPPEEART